MYTGWGHPKQENRPRVIAIDPKGQENRITLATSEVTIIEG